MKIRLALTSLLVAAVLPGGSPPKTRASIRIPVWLEPRQGEADAREVSGITVKLSGTPARVLRVLGPADGLMLLLVTDLTGDFVRVAPAKEALVSSIQKLPGNIAVGILRAQDGLKVLVDPTPDKGVLVSTIQDLPVSGNAGLLDTVPTVASIADSLAGKAAVRVAVLYVSDSDVQNYREDYTNPVINSSDPHDLSRRFPEGLVREKISRLNTTLAALQAPVFIVHLNYRSDRLNEAYQTGLMQLASTTGASASFCRSSGEVPEVIPRTLATIAAHYSFEVALPERAPRSLVVEVSGGVASYRQRFTLEGR